MKVALSFNVSRISTIAVVSNVDSFSQNLPLSSEVHCSKLRGGYIYMPRNAEHVATEPRPELNVIAILGVSHRVQEVVLH